MPPHDPPSRSTSTPPRRLHARRNSTVTHAATPLQLLHYTQYTTAAGNTLGDALICIRGVARDQVKHRKGRKMTDNDYDDVVATFGNEFKGVGEFISANPWFGVFLSTITANKIGRRLKRETTSSRLRSPTASPNSSHKSRVTPDGDKPAFSLDTAPGTATPDTETAVSGAHIGRTATSLTRGTFTASALASLLTKHSSSELLTKDDTPTLEYGLLLGSKFSNSLFSSPNAAAAVDEVLLQKSAIPLAALIVTHPWLRTFLESVAHHLLLLSSWGYKLRLFVALSLTYGDLLCDLVVVAQFEARGETGFRTASVNILLASIALQCFMVYLQYRKCGNRELAKQLLATVTLLRPYYDMHDVIVSAPLGSKLLLPSVWWFASRVTTSIFQSMPQMVVQLTALTTAGGSIFVWMSVAVASLSVAFTINLAAFDIESTPYNVKNNPDVYGILPNSREGRIVVLTVMTGITATVAFCRAFALSIAVAAGKRVALGYCVVEFFVFVCIKYYYRGTLNYWIIMGEPATTVVGWMKTLADYIIVTAVPSVQMRHPLEIGGQCLLVSVAVFLFSDFGLIKAAEVYSGEEVNVTHYKVVSMCVVFVVIQFGVLYSSMQKKSTLTRSLNGKRYGNARFAKAIALDSMEADFQALDVVLFLNKDFRPAKEMVAGFFRGKFETWERANPGWYTPVVRDKVLDHPDFPEDMWERYCGEDEEAQQNAAAEEEKATKEELLSQLENCVGRRRGTSDISLHLDGGTSPRDVEEEDCYSPTEGEARSTR